MAIFTGSKPIPGSMYPTNAVATVLGRLEPLLTPDQVKSRFLKGIPLTLKIKDPDTGKPFKITDEELADYIDIAIDEAEQETGLTIMPTQYSQKLPYHRNDWESFGYLQLPHRPIASIEEFTVRLSDGADVFSMPLAWVEVANLIHGQLNILPLAFSGFDGGTGVVGTNTPIGGSAIFFNSLWSRSWVSALFNVTYLAGFKDSLLPKIVNQLIGDIVAMRVLSQIAAAYAYVNSVSLGVDGLSQSTSNSGPQRYQVRMNELAEHRKLIVRKLRKLFGTSFTAGTV